MSIEVIERRSDPPPPPRRRKPPWFWWILANVTALCFAVLAWVGCLFVFSHPERPDSYRLLERIGRIPELTPFTPVDAPDGTPAGPRSLYRKFLPLEDHQLNLLNPRLLRNYLTNFKQPLLNTYVEGDFRVHQVRPLNTSDLFFPGFAVRARAEVRNEKSGRPAPYPVWVDFLFPTDRLDAMGWFATGDMVPVSKVPNCASVLHISRDSTGDEAQLILTAVPIAYGTWSVAAKRAFPVAPPERINPEASLPAFRQEAQASAPDKGAQTPAPDKGAQTPAPDPSTD